MGFNMWFIFTSLLVVSVRAGFYDQGPQKFYDISSDSDTAEQNENGEVILYLTPDQVRALEADGLVVQSGEDTETEAADSDPSAESQANENQEEAAEPDENEGTPVEEVQQEEQDNPEITQNEDIDFEEILRILNEEQVDEQEEEAAKDQTNESEADEDITESPRNFSPRITLRQQQQRQQKQETPAVSKNEQLRNRYSVFRYQSKGQRQRAKSQLFQQQQEANEAQESNEEPQSETSTQEKKKYKLIPYEIIEVPVQEDSAKEQTQNDEMQDNAQSQNDLIASLNAERFEGADDLRINRLQTILRSLKASPKYNNQKYMAISEKQNAASRAKLNSNATPNLKEELNKRGHLNKYKQGKGSPRNAETQRPQQLKAQRYFGPVNARPIPFPVLKAENPLAQRPIAVPVATSNRISFKNVNFRTRTDKPYIISRRTADIKRQSRVNARE